MGPGESPASWKNGLPTIRVKTLWGVLCYSPVLVILWLGVQSQFFICGNAPPARPVPSPPLFLLSSFPSPPFPFLPPSLCYHPSGALPSLLTPPSPFHFILFLSHLQVSFLFPSLLPFPSSSFPITPLDHIPPLPSPLPLPPLGTHSYPSSLTKPPSPSLPSLVVGPLYPAKGSEATKPQRKLNLVQFSHQIRHLVVTISMIFLMTNWPNSLHKYRELTCRNAAVAIFTGAPFRLNRY